MADNVTIQGLEFEVEGGGIEQSISGLKKLTDTLGKLKAATSKAASGGQSVRSAFGGKFANTLKSAGKQLASMPFKRLKGMLIGTIAPLKKFTSSIGRIALYRAVRSALRGITQALKEGSGYLNVYSKMMGTQFHKSLNQIATDALWLKASFATVVEPLINALAPAIDLIADKVAALCNLLAQLFAALSGKNTYTKAVKQATEYSDSISKAAEKTKDFTAGFDELNVFDPNKGKSSDLPDIAHLFEEAPIDLKLGEFGKQIKELVERKEWREIGETIADKVNGWFDGIDWGGIGRNLGEKINGVIEAAYGFLKKTDFRKIGNHIGDALNGALSEINFNTAGRLLTRSFTAFLDLLMGIAEKLDWGLLGRSIGDFLRGAFDEASEWLQGYDWKKVGKFLWQSLKDLIKGIDFGSLADSFFRLLGSAFGALGGVLDGFFGGIWDDLKAYWERKVAEAAGNIPEAFFRAILDGFDFKKRLDQWIADHIATPFAEGFAKAFGRETSGIEITGQDVSRGFERGLMRGMPSLGWGLWVYNHIFTPFVGKLKEWFGIHSPSRVMAEIGENVTLGFYQGIKDKIDTGAAIVRGWAKSVWDWFTGGDGQGTIFEKFSNAAQRVVQSFREKVSTSYGSVKTSITTWASSVRDWFTGAGFGGVNQSTFSTYANGVIVAFKDKINSTYGTVKTSVTTWAAGVKEWFTSASHGGINPNTFSTFASSVITGFKDKISSTYATTKTSITTWAAGVKDWFSGSSHGAVNASTFGSYASNVITGFKDKVSSTYSTSQSSITTWATSVKNWFSGIANSTAFGGYASDIISGFKDKISSSYSTVQSSITTWASSVKTWFSNTASGTSFGSIASDIVTGFKNGVTNNYTGSKSSVETWGSSVKSWFTSYASSSSFYSIASDVVTGFKNGIGALYSTCRNSIETWGSSIISWFKAKLNSNSPSKVFEQIGRDTILGYNIGLQDLGGTTKKIINGWADSFTGVQPRLAFAGVDASPLSYYDSSAFTRSISADVNTSAAVNAVGFSDGLEKMLDTLMPVLFDMADDVRSTSADMRRQADKREQTVVQIGGRVITDTITTQENANGYKFTR